jgi:hypothetical protein
MARHALLLITILATTGCTMSKAGRRGTIVTGVATAALGGFVISTGGPVDSDGNGVNDTVLNDNWGAYDLGSALFLAGLAIIVAAGASREPVEPAATAPTAPTPPVFAPASELLGPPGAGLEMLRPRLPELPATAEVIQLAKQIRSASANGHCDAVWTMWIDLEKLDADFARALREGPVMARCAP